MIVEPGCVIDVRRALPDVVVALLDDGAILTATGVVYEAGRYTLRGNKRESTKVMRAQVTEFLNARKAIAPEILEPGDVVGIFEGFDIIFLTVKEIYIPRQAVWATTGSWLIRLGDQNVAKLDLRSKEQ